MTQFCWPWGIKMPFLGRAFRYISQIGAVNLQVSSFSFRVWLLGETSEPYNQLALKQSSHEFSFSYIQSTLQNIALGGRSPPALPRAQKHSWLRQFLPQPAEPWGWETEDCFSSWDYFSAHRVIRTAPGRLARTLWKLLFAWNLES